MQYIISLKNDCLELTRQVWSRTPNIPTSSFLFELLVLCIFKNWKNGFQDNSLMNLYENKCRFEVTLSSAVALDWWQLNMAPYSSSCIVCWFSQSRLSHLCIQFNFSIITPTRLLHHLLPLCSSLITPLHFLRSLLQLNCLPPSSSLHFGTSFICLCLSLQTFLSGC